jgi:hypothetical protein
MYIHRDSEYAEVDCSIKFKVFKMIPLEVVTVPQLANNIGYLLFTILHLRWPVHIRSILYQYLLSLLVPHCEQHRSMIGTSIQHYFTNMGDQDWVNIAGCAVSRLADDALMKFSFVTKVFQYNFQLMMHSSYQTGLFLQAVKQRTVYYLILKVAILNLPFPSGT